MIPALLAALLSSAPVLEMTEPQLDAKIAEAHRLPFPERIDSLSRLFVGVPYTDLPLPDGKYKVRYLPLDQVQKRAQDTSAGSILMVVREHDPNRVVRITHMCFVVRTDAGLVVRHASTGKAVIDEPLDAFVQRQGEYKK